MLRGRVWVGTSGAGVLGSVQPACLPAAPFLAGAVSSAPGWAVTPAASPRLTCAVVRALAGEGCLDVCVISCGQCKPLP